MTSLQTMGGVYAKESAYILSHVNNFEYRNNTKSKTGYEIANQPTLNLTSQSLGNLSQYSEAENRYIPIIQSWIPATTYVSKDTKIGKGCRIEDRIKFLRSVIQDNVIVKSGAKILDSTIEQNVRIGEDFDTTERYAEEEAIFSFEDDFDTGRDENSFDAGVKKYNECEILTSDIDSDVHIGSGTVIENSNCRRRSRIASNCIVTKADISEDVHIYSKCLIDTSDIEEQTLINKRTTIKRSDIAKEVYIGKDCIIEDSFIGAGTKIGNNCRIKNSDLTHCNVVGNNCMIMHSEVFPYLKFGSNVKTINSDIMADLTSGEEVLANEILGRKIATRPAAMVLRNAMDRPTQSGTQAEG